VTMAMNPGNGKYRTKNTTRFFVGTFLGFYEGGVSEVSRGSFFCLPHLPSLFSRVSCWPKIRASRSQVSATSFLLSVSVANGFFWSLLGWCLVVIGGCCGQGLL
jgi:hypothetical protein